jgi:hypothetical protein
MSHDQPTVIVDSGASYIGENPEETIQRLLVEIAMLRGQVKQLEAQIYGGTTK